LAVGSQLGEVFAGPVLKALASGFGGLILCLTVVVTVFIANQRARKRQHAAV
jgi:hypothetical protein